MEATKEQIIEKIREILEKNLPTNTKIWIYSYKIFGEHIAIKFAPSDHLINGVSGQYPQLASLAIDLEDLELSVQMFGGSGGNRIYRKPNMQDSKEKYLAMKGVKIPFRKPKPELKFIYGAIERFCRNYVKVMRENKDQLMYSEYVDYDTYLNL